MRFTDDKEPGTLKFSLSIPQKPREEPREEPKSSMLPQVYAPIATSCGNRKKKKKGNTPTPSLMQKADENVTTWMWKHVRDTKTGVCPAGQNTVAMWRVVCKTERHHGSEVRDQACCKSPSRVDVGMKRSEGLESGRADSAGQSRIIPVVRAPGSHGGGDVSET
jgi:hypothetical protein